MRENEKMMNVVDFTNEEDDFAEDVITEDLFDEEVLSDVTEKKTGKAAYVTEYDRIYFGCVLDDSFLPIEEQKKRNIELTATVQSADSSCEDIREALGALIVENRRLIYGVARPWQDLRPSGTGVDDLLAVAAEAFIKAVKNFDPSKSSFGTYVWHQIEYAMRNHCRSPYKDSKITKIYSLEETFGADDNARLEDFLPDEHWADGYEQVECHEQVQALLGELNDRDRQIVIRRFNLFNEYDKPWSLEELGREFGYSRQGIKLILDR